MDKKENHLLYIKSSYEIPFIEFLYHIFNKLKPSSNEYKDTRVFIHVIGSCVFILRV